jgi:hypothetical protein
MMSVWYIRDSKANTASNSSVGVVVVVFWPRKRMCRAVAKQRPSFLEVEVILRPTASRSVSQS